MAPDSTPETDCNLLEKAHDFLDKRRVGEALSLFDRAERAACDPDDCAAGRWTCHMLRGDFEAAWRESDRIAQRGKPDPNRFWNGQPLAGKRVLIRCLHGLGDTIQFIRYAPLLREQISFLAIEAQPSLKPLLAASDLADAVFTWGEPEPPWDAQVEVIELPRIFRTTLERIPQNIPYLQSPCMWLHSNKPRVGVVWSASSYNPARSIPPEVVAPVFDTPGLEILSMQAGPERLALNVPTLRGATEHPFETACTIQQLNLVITVDTMMAHLAGALNIPVWTLLPYAADWRWMLDRNDSPWYPSMRLIRQPYPGEWGAVIRTVRADLMLLGIRGTRQCEEES